MSATPKENDLPRCESIEDVIRNFGDLHELAAEMDSYRELAISVEGRRGKLLSDLIRDNEICRRVASRFLLPN